jgi:hypothetical protein
VPPELPLDELALDDVDEVVALAPVVLAAVAPPAPLEALVAPTAVDPPGPLEALVAPVSVAPPAPCEALVVVPPALEPQATAAQAAAVTPIAQVTPRAKLMPCASC